MLKVIVFLMIIQSGMIGGCGMVKQNDGGKVIIDKVILDGNVMDLNDDRKTAFSNFIIKRFVESDDFYELLVTDNLVKSIINNESFVEVIFKEKQVIETGKFGSQSLTEIFIPLSGKFASNDQIVFFSGVNDFSNTPLINSNGRSELIKLLKE